MYKDGTPAGESLEEAQEYLTYSKEHHYVLSPSFTEQMPELLAEKYVGGAAYPLQGEKPDGRTKPGQLYEEIDGKKYI